MATSPFYSKDFNLRPANPEDTEEIKALIASVLQEFGLQLDLAGTDADLEDLQAHYLARGGLFEVLEDEQRQIVATLGLYPKREGVCELRKMYLRAQLRGRGLGSFLLKRALDQARALGFRKIELETASVLKQAIALYTRFQFRPVTHTSLASRCDQAYELELNQEETKPSSS